MTAPAAVPHQPAWRSFPPVELAPILRVALAQIVAHGYAATSVRAIAREVGVTVPALYYHFENKQAMLVALLDNAVAIVRGHLDAALADVGDDPVARFRAIVEVVALYGAHHRDLAFLDSERRSLTPANLAAYVAHRDRLEHELRDTIVAAQASGAFGTPDAHGCGQAILTMCQGIAGWFNPAGPETAEQVAVRYVKLALAMVEHTPAS